MADDPTRLLSTYFNDHLTGATFGVELARRARDQNEGTPVGRYLAELADEIEEDRDTLKRMMKAVGAGEDRIKSKVAWLAEKGGRLKPNNRLFGYSPLSRVIELEGLSLGVEGKRCLWEALREVADPRLSEFDFDALIERAARQRAGLEEHRLAAASTAFSSATAPAQ
jgi:hypothetical protein